MCVAGRCGALHLGGCSAAVMIGAAKRHGRSSSTLRGNCEHQQPDQKRSDQHTHSTTLTQVTLPLENVVHG